MCDLSRYSDEDIKSKVEQAVILQMGLLLLKYNQRAEFGERLREILSLLWQLSEQETALEYLETALRYIVGSADQVSAEELNQVVQDVLQEGARVMPTIAEQWLEQGREDSLEKGLEKGREEGREATVNILCRYLATRFGLELNHFAADLARLDLEAIIKLSDIAFAVNSLAEFETALAELKAEMETDAEADQPADGSRDDG